MNFERFVEISRALVPSKWCNKSFHTTFILRKGKIQSIGVNSDKTHPSILKYNYKGSDGADIRPFVGLHSELSAVLKYGEEDCSSCTFINIRIDKNGELNMSKPCVGCQHLLEQVGFKRLYFSTPTGDFEEWV